MIFRLTRNPGLALPLIALQYHEVKVILNHTFGAIYDGTVSNKLWCDYIYLDTDERRRFAKVSHEYLIEQVQEQTWAKTSQELNFNHPVKELKWRAKGTTDKTHDLSTRGKWGLTVNGHDRFSERKIK